MNFKGASADSQKEYRTTFLAVAKSTAHLTRVRFDDTIDTAKAGFCGNNPQRDEKKAFAV